VSFAQSGQASPTSGAVIVTVVQQPTHETTLSDVVLGSFGVVGSLLLIALVLGGVVSLVLFAWHRWFPPESDHLPSVSPLSGRQE
jgi:hypothetical protein